MSSKTVDYYNQNAASYTVDTISVELSALQNRFTRKLPEHALILDFGCGSGRDTKAFLNQGFYVDAIDGSSELCKIASQYTGIQVQHMYFQDLNEQEKYDAIWACSSILHLPWEELQDVLIRMKNALKPAGIIYTSFKYGLYEGERNGRYFTDMTEDRITEMLQSINALEIEESWITSDARPGRESERWLNLILRKK